MKEQEIYYKEYLGNNFFDFNIISKNIINSDAISRLYKNMCNSKKSWEQFYNFRDKIMFENFSKINTYFPEGKYYGQFGMHHVFQSQCSNVNWLASLINNSKYYNKVLSIIYIFNQPELYRSNIHESDNKNNNIFLYYFNRSNMQFQDPKYILVKLNAKNSPYSRSLIWYTENSWHYQKPNEGVTTDYFQYVLVINDKYIIE
jgi:hypothetical protein